MRHSNQILKNIKSPSDIKMLNLRSLNDLAHEIREKIVGAVSANGGHLASNLGAVELSIALHRVFNSPKDKIVWDVGHQCYAHKIITGRLDSFASLRKQNGLAGFPNRTDLPVFRKTAKANMTLLIPGTRQRQFPRRLEFLQLTECRIKKIM